MELPVISWNDFLDAVTYQQPSTLELRSHPRLFTNEGGIMADSTLANPG